MVNSMVDESKRWEDDWQALVEERRIFDKECERLDDAARRHHARLPPRDYAAEDRASAARLEEMAAARKKRELDRQKNLEAEVRIKTEEIEDMRMQDIDEENNWEAEYGEALEEDPAFVQPIAPKVTSPQSTAQTAIPDSTPEAHQQEQEPAPTTNEPGHSPSTENEQPTNVAVSGWEAEPTDRNTGWGWNTDPSLPGRVESGEQSSRELDYQAANSVVPSVDELDFEEEDAIHLS